MLIVFWAAGGICRAQSYTISGTVKDSITHKVLDYASIFIESADASIIAFTSTDESGKYKLTFKASSGILRISANLLGYKKRSYEVDTSTRYQQIDFLLVPDAHELKEVVVRQSKLPVFERNDTTTYEVSAYTDSTEYSVEDVLKKLPGVQVSENGTISINGKAIDKILIEGDDMFGANYTIGTRNIRADAIDKVQVIDHYQENPVLKDVRQSDETVINLSIKKEKKIVLSGSITAGAGYGDEAKWYLHSNLFSFAKRSKSVMVGNINNTGFNAMGEVNAVSGISTRNRQSIESGKIDVPSLLSIPDIQQIGLPDRFTNNRRLGLGSLSQVFNLTKRLKLSIRGTYYGSKIHQTYYHDNIFFSQNDTLHFREDNRFRRNDHFYELTAQAIYLPKSLNSRIKTYTGIVYQKNEASLSRQRSENNKAYPIGFDILDKPVSLFNAIEYSRKWGKKSVMQFVVDQARGSNNQRLVSSYRLYPVFFSLDSSFTKVRQPTGISKSRTRGLARYIYSGTVSANLEIGYLISDAVLGSSTDVQRAQDNAPAESIPLFQNKLVLRQSGPFAKLSLIKTIARMTVSAGMSDFFTHTHRQQDSGAPRYSNHLLSPFVRLHIPVGDDAKLRFYYSHNTSLPDERDLISEFVFSDYQTITRGFWDFTPIHRHSFGATFRYHNLFKSQYINAYIRHSTTTNGFGTGIDFTSDIFKKAAYLPATARFTSAGCRVEKLFQKIRSRFLIRYHYNRSRSSDTINSVFQDITFTSHRFYLDYGSAFDAWVNIFITNDFLWSQTVTVSKTSQSKQQAISWRPKVRLLCKPNKRFYADLVGYAITTSVQNGFNNRMSTADLNITWVFERKQKRNELRLSIVNLFSGKTFIANSIDTYYRIQYGLDLVPRFFILKWDTSL